MKWSNICGTHRGPPGIKYVRNIKVHLKTNFNVKVLNINIFRASLVAQWLWTCLPMQGTWLRALVWEDPTCRWATKPVRHNYWPCALEPVSHNPWSFSATREATAMRRPRTVTKSSPHSPQLEKARTQQQRPNAAKNK